MTADLHPGLTAVLAWPLSSIWPVTFLAGLIAASLLARLHGSRTWLRRIERKRLMTPAELRFWAVLRRALPDHEILGQVAMGALLKPVAGLSPRDWWSTYGRFSQKIVDFVVVDRCSGEVLAVVELDDASHDERRDEARDALLARGSYPVVRFTGRPTTDVGDVRARFVRTLDLVDRPIEWRPRVMS